MENNILLNLAIEFSILIGLALIYYYFRRKKIIADSFKPKSCVNHLEWIGFVNDFEVFAEESQNSKVLDKIEQLKDIYEHGEITKFIALLEELNGVVELPNELRNKIITILNYF